MSSSTQQKPADPSSSGPWQRWSGVATVLGTAIALIGLVVALLAWLRPQSPDDPPKPSVSPTIAGAPATPGAGTTSPPGTPAPAAAAVPLAGENIPVVAGANRLVAVPREVSAPGAIAIKCPTNETADQVSEVTYLLRGRYYQLDATVSPYYPQDKQAVTYVTALIGTRERDGTLRVTEAGSQKRAGPASPAALKATVEGAEQVTLRVECQNPNGTILIKDARLTP